MPVGGASSRCLQVFRCEDIADGQLKKVNERGIA